MADRRLRQSAGPLYVRIESGQLIQPDGVAAKVQNMYPTEEGTLRAITGPAPLVPNYGQGYPAYAQMHGIFHARLMGGEREVLLLHTGAQLWVFEGWRRAWRVLLGPSGSSPQVEASLHDDTRPRFPTQFENTPTGIVIAPQGGRSYFYDGEVILPLGYDRAPGAPNGQGPLFDSNLVTVEDVPQGGYNYDGTIMHPDFKYGRLGVGRTPAGASEVTGVLEQGSYRCGVQWIDRWGNLSPISGRSCTVDIPNEKSLKTIGAAPTPNYRVDAILKQVLWTDIEPGPEGTIGRILGRTRDELHTDNLALFELPGNAAGGQFAFATIPDNVAEIYPDNAPDSWLLKEMTEVDPVPLFKVCRMAFGRLWIAPTDAPGSIRPSERLFWGTFPSDREVVCDPSGAEITGMWRIPGGLLVFTASSSFLVTPGDDGVGFRRSTLHASVGCVAPDSIASMPDGSVVWLGERGFYSFAGGVITSVSDAIQRDLRTVNVARQLQATAEVDVRTGEYRCWVAVDGSKTNNRCFIFDGNGWRRREDGEMAALCRIEDHRQMLLAAGDVVESGPTTRTGVWVLDHEVQSFTPAPRTYVVETAWMGGMRSQNTSTRFQVRIWLRETHNEDSESADAITVESMRDYRETVLESVTAQRVSMYDTADPPPFWGASVLGSSGTTWKRRRPFWTRAYLYVPSSEAIKLRLTSSTPFEFLGLMVEEVSKRDGGARIAR